MVKYNKLVTFMGQHQELAILRRFQKPNVKALIGMQAEILYLESELAMIEREDKSSEGPSRASLPSVYVKSQSFRWG